MLVAVAEDVVAVVPTELSAAVVPEAGARLDGEGLRGRARARLDGARTPKRILVVPELPLRGPGKTDRHTVAALCRAV